MIFDGDAPREVQASRPLQKGKGRAATSLGAVPTDKQQQKQNKSGVGVIFLLWYMLFGFPTSAPARVFYKWWMWVWFWWWIWWYWYYVSWLYRKMVWAFRLRRRVSSGSASLRSRQKNGGTSLQPP